MRIFGEILRWQEKHFKHQFTICEWNNFEMLKCLTLEGILDYLDHFNHSLFSSALQGCQKIGDFHQGTGVLLRLADLSTMWSAGICQIDRSLANWISQQYLLMRLTDFWLLGLCVHQKVGKREKATAVNPESSRGIFALFPPCFAATCFFLRNCHRPGCWLPRAVLQISKQ